jgi:hypothetical protein
MCGTAPGPNASCGARGRSVKLVVRVSLGNSVRERGREVCPDYTSRDRSTTRVRPHTLHMSQALFLTYATSERGGTALSSIAPPQRGQDSRSCRALALVSRAFSSRV